MSIDVNGVHGRLAEAARETVTHGLNQGRTGNASARIEGGCLITPSGLELGRMTADDLLAVDFDGTPLTGTGSRVPSSEWQLHADIYRARPEVGAIIHTHSIAATALSAVRMGIPAFHYLVPALGGSDVRCTGYAIYGSPELAAEALRALNGRTACLLANHGVVACGATPEDALEAAITVEALAAQYCAARQVGEPILLSDAEVADLVSAFAGYRAMIAGGTV